MNYLAPCWTTARVDAFHEVVRAHQHGREAIRAAYAAIDEDTRLWAMETIAQGRLGMLATSAFVVPVLSPKGCRAITDRAAGYSYSPNDLEAPTNQIDEAVLAEVDPDQDARLQSVLMAGLAPWYLMIWGRLPSRLSSLQLAHYNPGSSTETGFHIDRDSSYTAVISLNPGEFNGGGTVLADGLLGDFHVPPLPAGHALIFDGQRVSHRGLHTQGNRKLLVVWADQRHDVW